MLKGNSYLDRDRCIGVMEHDDDEGIWLTRRISGDVHVFHKRKGIGWNLEMLAMVDEMEPPCSGLRAEFTDGTVLTCPWGTVRRLAMTWKFRLNYMEPQVLVPMKEWLDEGESSQLGLFR